MKPINLNRARKERARAEKRAKANANAAKFGRTKAEKAAEEIERERQARRTDGHRIDDK